MKTLVAPTASAVRARLLDARARTLAMVEDLSDEQLMGPRLSIVNPLRWEIAHVAWFQERWTQRHFRQLPPLRGGVDDLYDSARVAHDTRWDLPLLSRADTLDYMQRTLERALSTLSEMPAEEEAYFYQLALCHEDMHDEAFHYTRQTLGYPAPPIDGPRERSRATYPARGDARIAGGPYLLGAPPSDGWLPFVFDNEKWAHLVTVAPYAIARTPVTQREFAAFVDDRGYDRRALWSEAGWAWRGEARADRPLYWRCAPDGAWERRVFDRWVPIDDALPMIHVNAFEAEAWCRWAGRRLPTETEWEYAATGPGKRAFPWGDVPPTPERANLDGAGLVPVDAHAAGDSPDGVRQMMGNVWEWTATTFLPYPGFVRDPYEEYSEPWFATHRVLRGGCFATRARLLRGTWRNFYTPDRRDVWSGFRTCAL